VAETPDVALTKKLRDFAFERLDVDLFGVAPVERLEGAPAGARPTDYLPAARAVIVVGVKIPDGAIAVAGHYEEPGKTLSPYMWYGYVVPNEELSVAAARLARLLEKNGYTGLPFPPTGIMYKFGTRADFSHRHAAVAAGLGELGLSGLLLTPGSGARQRLVSIVTDAPLEPSPMYEGPALCRPDQCKRACIRACPTDALRGSVSVRIGDRLFEHRPVDPVRCKWQYPEKGYRRTKVAIPPDATDADFREVMRTTEPHPFDAALGQHAFVPQCGACVFRCPSPRFSTPRTP
jgi:epoxyqueuosine reductase QueG